jgi:starch phosphorylase
VRRDAFEAAALYDLIENSVAPRFYGGALPSRWIAMVRHTMTNTGPMVLSTRMLSDYVNELYTPAAVSARATAKGDFAAAKELAAWVAKVRAAWSSVSVLHVESSADRDVPGLGQDLPLKAVVALGSLTPADVEVQVAYGRVDDRDEVHDIETIPLTADGTVEGGYRYEATLRLTRPGPFGYTVRVLPTHPLLASTAELGLIATA